MVIGFLVVYLGLYIAARGAHYLVNFNGCNQRYGVRLFDTTGPSPPSAIGVGRMAVIVFFPLHRLETLVRHGPIHAALSW